jgi:hypothetical protein
MNQGDARAKCTRSPADVDRALNFKPQRPAFSAGVAAVFADQSSNENQVRRMRPLST